MQCICDTREFKIEEPTVVTIGKFDRTSPGYMAKASWKYASSGNSMATKRPYFPFRQHRHPASREFRQR